MGRLHRALPGAVAQFFVEISVFQELKNCMLRYNPNVVGSLLCGGCMARLVLASPAWPESWEEQMSHMESAMLNLTAPIGGVDIANSDRTFCHEVCHNVTNGTQSINMYRCILIHGMSQCHEMG